ncbi:MULTISPECIES: glutathione S-transferase family protein [Cyanophyceae]|uniref:Glutathione S-transferase C-terminal domain-containing protein n=1 Tax=Leptolyngbya subtilissima DQ-A4 TaxID=2933933 RepID=A0ABV0KB29_9CYAN|nr:glutathione S-transferase C-terminal domain-containing protein [Nodosilinea sp. FACHB-141]MBD2113777.1 glutathione S-transferase C-terminal domain-containing protein [Nodosilinea sp. FACHB-141]
MAGLPPGLLIRTAKQVWTTLWQTMMGQMAPSSKSGDYQRPESAFRQWVTSDGAYLPEANRYQLIVGMGCPWAHRTLVTRALKGLEEAISVLPVIPSPDEGCWVFETPFRGCRTLPEFYRQVKPGYQGRATVPVLWDRQKASIVNNESADIIVILNEAFNEWATRPEVDLYPDALKAEVDQWNDRTYQAVNNGVYRCGFAQTQAAYDRAVTELFDALDVTDQALGDRPYLCGDKVTLADVRLFTTLFRFDVVYYSLFKCNRRRIQDYAHLGPYLRRLYQLPGVAETCDIEAVKRDYYGNLFPLNPGGIIPSGPDLGYLKAPVEVLASR